MGIGIKIFKKFSEKIMNEGQVNNKIISKTGRYIYKKIKPEFIEKFGYKLYLDPDDQLLLSINEYPIHPILKKIISFFVSFLLFRYSRTVEFFSEISSL